MCKERHVCPFALMDKPGRTAQDRFFRSNHRMSPTRDQKARVGGNSQDDGGAMTAMIFAIL